MELYQEGGGRVCLARLTGVPCNWGINLAPMSWPMRACDCPVNIQSSVARFLTAAASVLCGIALFAGSAAAQGRGGFGFGSGARVMGGAGSRSGGRVRVVRPGRGRYSGGAFYPGYYPDYDSGYEIVDEGDPTARPSSQIVLAQPAPAPAPLASPGFVLENRDGQWVRISGSDQLPASPAATTSAGEATNASPALPAAVLIFRDGHREEVTRYMIQGDSLYIGTDYWSTGSWSRKIAISQLDIPASLKASADRGSNFHLPTASNEVVVRF